MRFTASMKASIVQEYLDGKDISHSVQAWGISPDELSAWLKHHKTAGINGLKVTRVQEIRRMEAV